MGKPKRPDRTILHRFTYPVYQLKAIGPNAILAAGGGGNSKTGIPNRIDVIQFDRPAYAPSTVSDVIGALIPSNTTVVGGLDTKCEAIMHMALGCKSSGAASLIALEGPTCQEYFFHANHLEPLIIAESAVDEQEACVSSSGLFRHRYSPSNGSSSSSEEGVTGISSTTSKRPIASNSAKDTTKNAADSTGLDQLSWTCEALRSVSVAPTKALMERRRLDSCSSTGSVSAMMDDGDELTCIATGGPVGGTWCAVGTIHGGVALIDRYALAPRGEKGPLSPPSSATHASYAFTFDDPVEDAAFPLQPFCTLPDASGGRCAPVCDVALSASTFPTAVAMQPGDSTTHQAVTPLLATISGRPMGSLLCIWCLPTCTPVGAAADASSPSGGKRVKFAMSGLNEDSKVTVPLPLLYAEVKLENAHVSTHPSKHSTRSENGTRFRHCEFLRWMHHQPPGNIGGPFTFLVTTEQPVSPTTRSVCHLSVWLVPLPFAAPSPSEPSITAPPATSASGVGTKPQAVLGLERFAAVPLPPGEIPACIAVHPSPHRGIIALGSMEGSVDVFMISLKDHSLVRVYSMPKAHPIFVTSLTFLPPRNPHQQTANCSILKHEAPNRVLLPPHYELVSSSADRVIRWHCGPSLQTVALIGAKGVRGYSTAGTTLVSYLLVLLLVLALPLLVAMIPFTL